MKFALGAATLFFVAGIGQLQAQELIGDVALSFGSAPFLSTDDDGTRLSESGYKASGFVGTNFGEWRVVGDLNIYRRSIGSEDFDTYAPGGARSFGLHGGRSFGSFYVGAFLGRNQFQGDDASKTNGYLSGRLYGIEGQYDMGNMSVFGQLGRAKMIGDGTDTQFVGHFARLGMSATFDKWTVSAEVEKGRSPDNFEDGGDWGEYKAVGLGVDYRVTDRLIATASYEKMDITANTEDSGYDEYYGLGVRIPLGASTGARNNLTTTYRPGLVAAWAETLD